MKKILILPSGCFVGYVNETLAISVGRKDLIGQTAVQLNDVDLGTYSDWPKTVE